MSRVRATFLTDNYPRSPGGGAAVCYRYANDLAARGWDVSVVHPLGLRPRPPGSWVDAARGKVRDVRAGSLRRRIGWLEIHPNVRIIETPRLEVAMPLPPADVRVATFWRTSEVLAARPADGVPTVQLLQAYETWGGPEDRVNATWRLPWPKVVISTALRRTAARLDVPPGLVHVIPNAVDHEMFQVDRSIDERSPVVLFLAHPAPTKGLPEAVQVAVKVRQERRDVRFVAFGGLSRPSALPEFIAYHQRPVGSALAALYNEAAVFLCTSTSEGWGLTSMEAMACGAALVSTSNGGVDDFATDGESARICPVGDIEGLSTALLELLSNPGNRITLATAGRSRTLQFSWDKSTALFREVVDSVLQGAQ